MIIASKTGRTSHSNIQVQKSCRAIGLIITKPSSVTTTDTPELSISINTNNGQKTICNNVKITFLSEYSSKLEGAFNVVNMADGGVKTIMKVLLSEDGNVTLQNSEHILIELTKCHADVTYQLFTIEDDVFANTYLSYDKYITNGTQPDILNITNSKDIMVAHENFVELTSTYAGGYTQNASKVELQANNIFENDTVAVISNETNPNMSANQVFGFAHYLYHDVDMATEIQVYGNYTEFYVITEETL